jgi:hypothetical protein
VNDPTLAGADDFEPATQRDYLTQAGAEALAHKIAAYWKGLGFEVRVSSGPGGRGLTRQIESDLVRGLPPPPLAALIANPCHRSPRGLRRNCWP